MMGKWFSTQEEMAEKLGKEEFQKWHKRQLKGEILGLILVLVFFGAIFLGVFVFLDDAMSSLTGITRNVVKDPLPLQVPKEEKLTEQTFIVEGGELYYWGGNYENPGRSITKRHVVMSNNPVEIYVVPSQSDFNLISSGKEFIHYPSCRGLDILHYNEICRIDNQGGIVIRNKGYEDAIVTLKVYEIYD